VAGQAELRLAANDVSHRIRATMKKRCMPASQVFSYMNKDRSDVVTFDAFKYGISILGMRPAPTEGAKDWNECQD